MPQYTHRGRNSVLLVQLGFTILFFVGQLSPALLGQTPPGSSQTDNSQASGQWKESEVKANAALKEASVCMSKALRSGIQSCSPSALLAKAADEYGKMELLLVKNPDRADKAAVVAHGFIRSGQPRRAIEFLMRRHEVRTDPNLAHLLADALFAIGDFESAARAYAVWIRTGCRGYFYSMHVMEPWLMTKGEDRCASLPVALRSRLEMLQEVAHGKPANLPGSNRPPGRYTVHY